MDTVNTELIRGHADTIILNVLLERDRYGYEILELISQNSEGRYAIKQPTLYSCLKRLEKQGFISSYFGDESNGGRRRYYKLEEKGRKTLDQDQREWEFSRSIIDRLLSDKQIDLKTVEAPFDTNELRPLTKRVKAYDIQEAEKMSQPIIIPITLNPTVNTAATSAPITENKPEETKTDESVRALSPEAIAALNKLYSQEPPVSEKPEEQVKTVDSAYNNVQFDNKNAQSVLFGGEMPNKEKEKADFARTEVLTEEELHAIENRNAASRLLKLGDYSDYPYSSNAKIFNKNSINTDSADYKLFNGKNDESFKGSYFDKQETGDNKADEDVKINYREALGAIFDRTVPSAASIEKTTYKEAAYSDQAPARARGMSDLKQSLLEEGYKMRTYSKANNAGFYYMNYYYSNRILRDTSLFTYLVAVIELLIMFILRSVFGLNGLTLIIMGVVGLILPIVPTVLWAVNPNKRIKAKFNFNAAIINALIAFIVISAVATVINLVSPSISLSFQDGKMYVPYILALDIPIFVLIYQLLYRTKNYHLK